tara:strand:- start:1010 stop:2617 length:1608 start_codon:yes stop_codon:yes gene_type:complete
MSTPNRMDTILRYKCRQGGNFTETLNKCTFDIPQGTYDFSKSFVELVVRYDQETYTSANQTGCVANFLVSSRAGLGYSWDPASYFRRVRLRSQNHGSLEDIDRVDVLRNALNTYHEDVTGLNAHLYNKPSQIAGQNSSYTPFREFNFTGDQIARRKTERIIIKLSDLIELGKEPLMPFTPTALGRGTLDLDLELSNIPAIQTPNHIIGPVGSLFPQAVLGSQTLTSPAATTAIGLTRMVFPAVNNNGREYSKFYVGQAVTVAIVTDSGAGGLIAGADANVIKSITMGSNLADFDGGVANNFMIVEFKHGLNAVALASAATWKISMTPTLCATVPVAIYEEAQLVLHQINRPVGQIGQLSYMTFTTELHSTEGTSLLRNFVVEPNAINIFIANSQSAAHHPISTAGNLHDYRLAVNGTPIINRTVQIGNVAFNAGNATFPGYVNNLHWELLSQAFLNGNIKLDSLLESTLRENSTPASQIRPFSGTTTPTRQLLIGTPLPMTNSMKLFQIELNRETTGGAIGDLQLFKQILRVIPL